MLQTRPRTTTESFPVTPHIFEPDFSKRHPINEEFTYLEPLENVEYHPVSEKLSKKHRAKVLTGYILTSVLAAGVPYGYDAAMNRIKEESAIPTIETIVEAPSDLPDTHSSTYFMNGFDTNNADIMTMRLAPAFSQISPDDMKSIHYGNARLNPRNLAERIVEDAEANGDDSVTLVGNSTGGIIALIVAEQIIKNSDIKVKTVYLSKTPDGVDGLKPGTKKELAALMEAISFIPEAEYSSYARDILTVIMENSRYTRGDNIFENVGKFIDTFWDAVEQTRDETRPSVRLVADQGWTIANADLESRIEGAAEAGDEEYMYNIVNLSVDDDLDTVVDNAKSIKNICGYAKNVGIDCFNFRIDSRSERHTSYNFDAEAYIKTLALGKTALLESYQQNESAFALQRFEYYQHDTMIAR